MFSSMSLALIILKLSVYYPHIGWVLMWFILSKKKKGRFGILF